MRGSTSAVLLACLGASLVLGAAARSARVPAPTFAPAKNYEAGAGGTGLGGSVAVGDLNGDGSVDVVTSNGLAFGGIAVLLNRGRGTFRGRVLYGSGNTRSVAIGDLDRDGVNDVAAVNFGQTVSVFLNRGNGTFAKERRYRSAGETDIAVGDLNGDGSRDIVTANQKARSVSVLLNRGDGSFEPKVDYHVAQDR